MKTHGLKESMLQSSSSPLQVFRERYGLRAAFDLIYSKMPDLISNDLDSAMAEMEAFVKETLDHEQF